MTDKVSRIAQAPVAVPAAPAETPAQFSAPAITGGLMRVDDVCAAIAMSKSCLYDMVKNGRFPQPVRMGTRFTRWRSRDVYSWMEALQ